MTGRDFRRRIAQTLRDAAARLEDDEDDVQATIDVEFLRDDSPQRKPVGAAYVVKLFMPVK